MLGAMRDFLSAEKAPYLVTIFVAALAWTSIRTADRLSNTPFVEYRIATVGLPGSKQGVEIRLRNITQASSFPCFLLTIASEDPVKYALGPSENWDQVLRGTVLVLGTPKRASAEEGEIELRNLSPGADIALRIPTKGDGILRLLVRSCPQLEGRTKIEDGGKSKSQAAVGAVPILIPRSVTTFFVEWEISILWAVLALWLIAMVRVLSLSGLRIKTALVENKEVEHDG